MQTNDDHRDKLLQGGAVISTMDGGVSNKLKMAKKFHFLLTIHEY